jgi:hypothetical protein
LSTLTGRRENDAEGARWPSIERSREMRFSVGGCVENIFWRPPLPPKIHRALTVSSPFISLPLAPELIFSSARAIASGLCVNVAASSSATYSRYREMAITNIITSIWAMVPTNIAKM